MADTELESAGRSETAETIRTLVSGERELALVVIEAGTRSARRTAGYPGDDGDVSTRSEIADRVEELLIDDRWESAEVTKSDGHLAEIVLRIPR